MPDILNAHDYEQYKAAVASFIEKEGISLLSTGTADIEQGEDPETTSQEPWFSRHPCECCYSPLGGNREYLYGIDAEDQLHQYQICEDCVYYIHYGRLDDQTMARIEESEEKPMNSNSLTATLLKSASILMDDEEPNADSALQAMVGDAGDTRTSTFVQFDPNPGSMQKPNPLSPIEGDYIFFAYMMPGSRFQDGTGAEWMIQNYVSPDEVEIYNIWYPHLEAVVSVADIRRSIRQWTQPITQTVPPPPPGVDYGAQPVKIVDGAERVGAADEITDYKNNANGSW